MRRILFSAFTALMLSGCFAHEADNQAAMTIHQGLLPVIKTLMTTAANPIDEGYFEVVVSVTVTAKLGGFTCY